MDVRSMRDDEDSMRWRLRSVCVSLCLGIMEQSENVLVVQDDKDKADPAWPPWKQLLEDLAEAHPPPSTVKLAYKNLGDAGAFRLAELLKGPLQGVKVLDLSCTSVGSSGACAIAAVLPGHAELRALDMSSNAVTDVGAMAFAQSMTKNSLFPSECVEGKKLAAGKTLESARDERRLYLVIGGSLIGKNEQLASAICDMGSKDDKDAWKGGGSKRKKTDAKKDKNNTLLELNLRQNYISDTGATRIANAIRSNKTLRVCDVQSNSYGQAGRACLHDAYKSNGQVERSMPLAWHAAGRTGQGEGEEGTDAVLARLALPPRSLVSVDSALDASKTRHSRKKTPSSNDKGASPSMQQNNLRSCPPPALLGSSSRSKPAIFCADHDDNSKAVRRGRFHCVMLFVQNTFRLKRIQALRMFLLLAIVVATVLLWISHSTLEDIEDRSGRALLRTGDLLLQI
ncbi:hypothetical protein GUITHDRAFT_114072 [Guillardia theta CCMP2712]|uniref:Uncharacterized protein n=1 Tax=Guillardia theta (strain CCMP2712) TaxID=905079 RepID=L1IUA2_GUITC|nr:hypothetical protein GUITHDRAFT_114072 [Guillardia theta CCMP2712]EKX39821.1 hypothetical protein GUITHDRAFT_114072 [Guillardia theta CCMP2712]|eukprot:XP_005826801.1 hypothetical protein GUITHDRAFT_114072 [Guillardia theta CCMP2712]